MLVHGAPGRPGSSPAIWQSSSEMRTRPPLASFEKILVGLGGLLPNCIWVPCYLHKGLPPLYNMLAMSATERCCIELRHRKNVIALALAFAVVLYYSKGGVARLADWHSRGDISVRTVRQILEQALVCRSEVAYLCWTLRPTIDAGFRGDMEVMARHINSNVPKSSLQPGQPGSRGIVVSAGGVFASNAFINLYVLQRFLNCTLPVALMYWGKSLEDVISDSTRAFMQAHLSNIQFIDASVLPYPAHHRWLFPPDDPWLFNGWKVKVFALFSAPFDEVLLLDGDSMPFQDVGPLFDHPAYKLHGNLFWADPWCKPVKLFRHLGVADPWQDGRKQLQTEAGQLLFNRKMHADVLEWVLFLNTHDEFTYHYAYGDKDSFRAAFLLANKSEAYSLVPHQLSVPLYRAGQGGSDMLVQGLFHHHPDGNLLFLHRAGKRVRKYNLAYGAGHPISHLMFQPSCEYATRKRLWNPTVRIPSRDIITPSRCHYDLANLTAARRVCGLASAAWGSAGASSAAAPVFEVLPETHVARVQQQLDAAFFMVRERRHDDPSLF